MPMAARCGDGVHDATEACDDGNTRDGDGCSALCVLEDCTEPDACSTGCVIGGLAIADGVSSSTNACLFCQASVRDDVWSPQEDGTDCAPPDACGTVGACSAGVCVISDGCADETPVCDASTLSCVCSSSSCDDDVYCNGKESCGSDGACASGEPIVCASTTPHCDEDLRACVACLDDRDCTGDNPACLLGVCVACAGCPCPIGEHDGGDGTCVPVTTCSEGFARVFVDGDGDGLGAGAASLSCHALPVGDGLSTIGTDCDDDDFTRSQWVTVYPDADGDGFTAGPIDLCVGDTLPDWVREAPMPPPRVSLGAREAVNQPGGSGSVTWQNLENIRVEDGQGVFCRPLLDGCRYIVIRRLDLAIPSDVVITGFVVELVKRASADDTGVIFESHVQLAPAGVPAGENRADPSTSWPFEYTSAFYGGMNDTWGLALTPAMLNDVDFGIAVSLASTNTIGTEAGRIDAVRIRVFTDEARSDCDDADEALYALRPLYVDADGDGYVVAGSLDDVCVGTAMPAGRRQNTLGNDCYDSNANARPGQTSYYGAHRGDGSFDYNCNGSSDKESITAHTSCACDADAIQCLVGGTTNVTPAQNCGNSTNVNRCTNECSTCALAAQSFQVRCR
jgi:cysteine-rich repeat protein